MNFGKSTMDKWVRQIKDERGGIVPKATQTSPIFPYLSIYLTSHQKNTISVFTYPLVCLVYTIKLLLKLSN